MKSNKVPLPEKQIPQYVNWLSQSKQIDQEWFSLVKSLIIKHKLPVMSLLQNAFERLGSKKNQSLFRKYQIQFLQIYQIIKLILTKADPHYTLRCFGLNFLETLREKIEDKRQFKLHPSIKQEIYFGLQELALYKFVWQSKKVQWQCKRKVRSFIDYSEFQNMNESNNIDFSVVEEHYQIVNQKYRKKLDVVQLRYFDDQYAKYRQCRGNLQNFMSQNKMKPLPFPDEEQTYQGQMQFSNSSQQLDDSIQFLNSHQYQQQIKKVRQGQRQQNKHYFNVFPNFSDDQKDIEPIPKYIPKQNSNQKQKVEAKQALVNSIRLCCRPYFIRGQVVGPESRDVQYKNYGLPWTQNLQYKIGKTICAFLNSNGGNIFIGIQQNQIFQRKVVGRKYTEAQKEQVYKKLREIAQTIKPDIIAHQLFDVNFIPVVTKKDGSNSLSVIKNYYVVKVSVHQGFQGKLYTIINRQKNYEEVCIRTWNQIITYRNMHEVLQLQEQRIMKGIKIERLYPHENPCNDQQLKIQMLKSLGKKQLKKDTKLQKSNVYQNDLRKQVKPKSLIIRENNSSNQYDGNPQQNIYCIGGPRKTIDISQSPKNVEKTKRSQKSANQIGQDTRKVNEFSSNDGRSRQKSNSLWLQQYQY